MRYSIDENKRLSTVYCIHADQESEGQQRAPKDFIADCRARKIFVCAFHSGNGDLLENTKELLAYNYQNAVIWVSNSRSLDGDAR